MCEREVCLGCAFARVAVLRVVVCFTFSSLCVGSGQGPVRACVLCPRLRFVETSHTTEQLNGRDYRLTIVREKFITEQATLPIGGTP